MKIVVVTPAGRKRYLNILYSHLKLQKENFKDFEWHLWENSRTTEDEKYIKSLVDENNWVKLIQRDLGKLKGTNLGITKFWDYTTDIDTIYIRLDDDIVWLEKNFIKTLAEFRLNNPNYTFVFGNIVNNNIIDHIHQRIGAIKINTPINYARMGNSWNSKELPLEIHKQMLQSIKDNNINKWKFSQWVLNLYERVSINALCWKGGDIDFTKMAGDEEQWVSVEYPKTIQIPNIICGTALCVHAGFVTQRTEKLEIFVQKYK
jgi:hypothetical protein